LTEAGDLLNRKGDHVPERRLPMRQIKEVLRLHYEAHLSERQIAHACRISRSTVQRYLERAAAANLCWPLPPSLDDGQLERLLFPPPPAPSEDRQPPKPQPDFARVHRELKANKSVTLQLLWQEFVEQRPDGAQYSWFCEQYRDWARHLDVVLRQDHRAGEKTFVDHAGDTIQVIDPATGQTRPAYVFVAVLGASNYTYAEATWTRSLPDWIGSHTRALAFFGGATRLIVPDQWKAGVDKPCYWDPELNRSYQEWAMHNAVAIVPARPGHARDKAKVEQGVLLVQRWIVAALRKRQFFSLAQVNGAIAELIGKLNQRPFHKLPGSRLELYQKLDRPALQPLPPRPYVFAQWKKERVRLDYHVDVDGHYYSVPYQLAQQPVEIRYTATTVEVLCRGKRVASHARSWEKPGTTTETSHQPKSHQRYREWTPTRLLEWAEATGPFTRRLVEAMLVHKPHPEAGYRAAMGLRPLAGQYGEERLEAAAIRAVRSKLYRLDNIRSILKTRLDQQPLPMLVTGAEPVAHDNIRGAAYYGVAVEDEGAVEVAG
jgi:transposase